MAADITPFQSAAALAWWKWYLPFCNRDANVREDDEKELKKKKKKQKRRKAWPVDAVNREPLLALLVQSCPGLRKEFDNASESV